MSERDTESAFKGSVHAAMATGVGVLLAYNVMRWCTTRQRRNAINIAIYTPLLVFEWMNVKYHWRQV